MKNKTKKVSSLSWIKDERELNLGVKCDWIMNENKGIKQTWEDTRTLNINVWQVDNLELR